LPGLEEIGQFRRKSDIAKPLNDSSPGFFTFVIQNQKFMIEPSQKLSNLQLELLKIFSRDISDMELMDIRRLLTRYFMERAVKNADEIWEQKGYSKELMEQWLKEDS
jgi:hypothetical protein